MKKTKKYFDIYAPVFYPSAGLILLTITFALLIGEPLEEILWSIQSWITEHFGWFFILTVNVLLISVIYFAFGKFGKLKLGGEGSKPEFSFFAWLAMLFSAGMGIGLLFFGVAEPISNFDMPPVDTGVLTEEAHNALVYTYLHWGFHGWAIYALVGLALAFFSFSRKLPFSIRSVFYPIFGERIYGRLGDVIDILSVVSTLFGLTVSLGLGAQQITSGLNYLFGIPNQTWMHLTLIGFITAGATISVVLGLNKGIRVLSKFNMRLAVIFLFLMIIIGPTLFLLNGFVQTTGGYLQNIIKLGTWTGAYTNGEWQSKWTFVYWAWWISWSPFVGMFIARISMGRTIKEFVLGVLLAPAILTFFWISVFGGSALFLEINGIGELSQAVKSDISTALFAMLREFPLDFITSFIGIVLVIIFFVTSSDSGSLVIDYITSGGKLDAPVGQRIFWALSEGGVAAVLLLGGGLVALQTAVLSIGLPFALVLLIMCYSLYKGLLEEYKKRRQ
ncbi:BCCT family transporter [Leptobacterium flavescens]|uniref:BCCT family transporter n=1 Tax=Leptobacterium flavescens TaxID=472055 RepID=A0A6P0UN28_9FLAO|nr:BCCT family transporter [Leptobacterium flavescens]NER13912.1 BCCT family transporter [Leptobacterium flavescens]